MQSNMFRLSKCKHIWINRQFQVLNIGASSSKKALTCLNVATQNNNQIFDEIKKN